MKIAIVNLFTKVFEFPGSIEKYVNICNEIGGLMSFSVSRKFISVTIIKKKNQTSFNEIIGYANPQCYGIFTQEVVVQKDYLLRKTPLF